jgi:DNA-binding IclR family transcriptional regulator
LVFLWLYGRAARDGWRPVTASLRTIADETGLSKSAVQAAVVALQRNELITTDRAHRTAVPRHRVLRHWQQTPAAVVRRANHVRAGGRRGAGKRKATRVSSRG